MDVGGRERSVRKKFELCALGLKVVRGGEVRDKLRCHPEDQIAAVSWTSHAMQSWMVLTALTGAVNVADLCY